MAAVMGGSRAPLSTSLAGMALALALAVGALTARAPLLVVAAVLLVTILAATLVSAQVTTLIVIFLLFINAPGVAVAQHGAPTLVGAAVPLLLAIPLLTTVWRGGRLIVTPTFVLILVLLLVEMAATLASAHQDVALNKLQTFGLEGVLLYFLVSNVVRTPEALRRALWAVIAAGGALALLTVFQAVTQRYFSSYGGFALPDPSFFLGKVPDPRASGPVGDANYYGQILIVAAAMGLVFAWRGRTLLERVLATGATALMAYAITLTNSRGTGVAFALLLVVMAFLRYFKGWQVVTMMLAVVVLLVAVPSYGNRLTTLTSVKSATAQTGADAGADQSAQGRSTEMIAAAQVAFDHPLLGVGPAVFPLYYRRYAEQVGGEVHDSVPAGSAKGAEAQRQAHNVLLGEAADLGVLGLLAFCGILGVTIRTLVRTRRESLRTGRFHGADLATALLLAVIGYLLTGMFLTLAFERYFWLLLGLAGAATSLALREAPPGRRAPPHLSPRRPAVDPTPPSVATERGPS